jgi:hypothetical protein
VVESGEGGLTRFADFEAPMPRFGRKWERASHENNGALFMLGVLVTSSLG